ncbi:YisL family protein [Virgibacillus sp. W0430]|uniref:YisL family protein n=1 Tax=Virgibacillus sp. W0430 TaxID=3391580 RepID=UPI003F472D58
MAHLHITAWVLAVILVFIVSAFYGQEKTKQGKILHMILRLDYLLILYSGGSLLGTYIANGVSGGMLGEVIVKVIAGLWAIVAMEMIGVKTKKSKPVKSWWIQFAIAAIIAIGLGFGRLPLGILP